MGSVIEGRNAVIEALRAGVPIDVVLLMDGSAGGPIDEIRRLARERGVAVKSVARSVLEEQSARGAHQGVMATAAPFSYTPLAEVVKATEGRDRSLVIVLDHVTDEGNLGAIARSAEVAGADAIVVPKARAAKAGAVAYKTSAGALATLPVVREANVGQVLTALKAAGYWVAGASEKADTLAWDAPLDGRLVLVMGAEGTGLSRIVERACDFLVRLPVAGAVGSLNVAHAATVLAFEWVRRGSERT